MGVTPSGLRRSSKSPTVHSMKRRFCLLSTRAVSKPWTRASSTHLGSLATIGRKAAVADFGWVRLSGALAWWLWGAVHTAFLVGLHNRISVMWD